MFKIGDFARIAQVTVRALRLYDERGLLRPARVDAASGYRYYTAGQLTRLNRILALKDLDFSLDEIARVLDGDFSPDRLRAMLDAQAGGVGCARGDRSGTARAGERPPAPDRARRAGVGLRGGAQTGPGAARPGRAG